MAAVPARGWTTNGWLALRPTRETDCDIGRPASVDVGHAAAAGALRAASVIAHARAAFAKLLSL